jgi:TonB family protein
MPGPRRWPQAASAARLTLSSGSATLDAAALRLVRDSAPLPAPPRDMNLRVPIEFR